MCTLPGRAVRVPDPPLQEQQKEPNILKAGNEGSSAGAGDNTGAVTGVRLRLPPHPFKPI